MYNTAIEATIVENVFPCQTENTLPDSSRNTNFFVSSEYNVSDDTFFRKYIAGRFIFRRTGGKFYYEGLAEEPAKVVEGENVEELYLEMRKDRELGKKL